MTLLRLPGLVDPHVHMREPGGEHKEDWDSGTQAALAGGFTCVLAMPNTQPPITDTATLAISLAAAQAKARCDYGQYVGAGPDNVAAAAACAPQAAGLKLYLDQTFGPLRLDDMTLWMEHLAAWPANRPIVAHAEGRTLAAIILVAELYRRPVHLAHVSRREEILLIRAAKARGLPVTCEVTPHHLFLCDEDSTNLGEGWCEVRPRLATAADRQALWDNLDVVDCFATDHAPHTVAEKAGPNPPPGFPGLETALPLLLTAVQEGRLTMDDLVARMATNPRHIFGLPAQPHTWIEVDPDAHWTVTASELRSRSGWTPFAGWPVRGRVRRVVLRGQTAYDGDTITAPPGFGQPIHPSQNEKEECHVSIFNSAA
ncbi:MAG: amidohydrolase family protein [Anaerolineae bacterium]